MMKMKQGRSRRLLFSALTVLATSAAWGANARRAHASCTVSNDTTYCFPNVAGGHKIWFGSDSEGQWVAYQRPDGSCDWSLVGPPSGMGTWLDLFGGTSDDEFKTTTGQTICGFPLQIPEQNGFYLFMEGSGGVDKIVYNGTGTSFLCGDNCANGGTETSPNQLITADPGPFLLGSEGQDALAIHADGFAVTPNSSAILSGKGGNDVIFAPKRGSLGLVDCGGGSADQYCGPSATSGPTSCEVPSSTCNLW